MSQEKGEANIFNILDIKSENSSENKNDIEKEKEIQEKELMEVNVNLTENKIFKNEKTIPYIDANHKNK